MKAKVMVQTENFNLRYYFKTLTRLLSEPRRFFSEMAQEMYWKNAFCFLLISSLFYAAASVVGSMSPRPLVMGGIYLTNAVGMTLIAAIIGFTALSMSLGKRVSFGTFFSIYAFSSGVTLLSSWMPYFLVITEPWKWWLVYTGLKNVCRLSGLQSFMIIAASIAIQLLLFWTLLPLII